LIEKAQDTGTPVVEESDVLGNKAGKMDKRVYAEKTKRIWLMISRRPSAHMRLLASDRRARSHSLRKTRSEGRNAAAGIRDREAGVVTVKEVFFLGGSAGIP
jgi:hypothetical protein